MIPDSSLNLVFILGQTRAQLGSHDYTVTCFNQTTFAPVRSIVLSGLVDLPYAMIRWGSSGLALVTYESYNQTVNDPPGMLYVLNDAAFLTPATALASPNRPPEEVQRTWKTQQLPGTRGRVAASIP